MKKIKTTLETSEEDQYQPRQFYAEVLQVWFSIVHRALSASPQVYCSQRLRVENYTRNEWRRYKLHSNQVKKMETTLETSEEDLRGIINT